MHLPVHNRQGEVVDQLEVADLLFDVPMNMDLVHQALLRQRANARVGTHATKTRGRVRGGGRKPWRQKYTGRARQGSIRSPIWRGGGVVFGPQPRSYRQDIPVRMRRQALRCTLSSKVRDGELILVDELAMEHPRTKEMVQTLTNLGVTRSALIVTREPNKAVIRSAHNIPRVKTLPASYLNIGDLLSHERLVITVEALRRAEELWARSGRKGQK